jgi:poly-gamma-glutamate synthesis protein (capsule biosynthesis protein)
MLYGLWYVVSAIATALFPTQQQAELLFAGDAMQHTGQIEAARRSGGATYDYSECFTQVAPYVKAADFAVVNLEAPLGGKPYAGYPCFSAPDEYAQALIDAGFDMMLTANNHTLDRRDAGLHRTLKVLDQMKVMHLGTYHDRVDHDTLTPKIVNVKGFKIAFLNYTYGTNGFTVSGTARVNYINHEQMRKDVADSRRNGAEIVAVCIHWGEEYHLLPNAAQRKEAEFLSSLDVDMIIGGHPHVIQPMEMRTNHSGRPMLLVYSLGNFISNMKTTDTRGGAMVKVTLRRDATGRASVADAKYSMVFTTPGNYKLVPADKSNDSRATAFRQSAESIFRKYNVNVTCDSTFNYTNN